MVGRGPAKVSATLRVGTGCAYWRQRHDPPLDAVEVAQALNISKSTYSLIEQGRLLPNAWVIDELVRILGVPPGALFIPEVLTLVVQQQVSGDPMRWIDG